MRPVLNTSPWGDVVIGEGEKDEAPMLYNGEEIGGGTGPEFDFAVDPVDGTTLTAKSLPNALAIDRGAERDTMFDPGPCVYMEKIAVRRTWPTSSISRADRDNLAISRRPAGYPCRPDRVHPRPPPAR